MDGDAEHIGNAEIIHTSAWDVRVSFMGMGPEFASAACDDGYHTVLWHAAGEDEIDALGKAPSVAGRQTTGSGRRTKFEISPRSAIFNGFEGNNANPASGDDGSQWVMLIGIAVCIDPEYSDHGKMTDGELLTQGFQGEFPEWEREGGYSVQETVSYKVEKLFGMSDDAPEPGELLSPLENAGVADAAAINSPPESLDPGSSTPTSASTSESGGTEATPTSAQQSASDGASSDDVSEAVSDIDVDGDSGQQDAESAATNGASNGTSQTSQNDANASTADTGASSASGGHNSTVNIEQSENTEITVNKYIVGDHGVESVDVSVNDEELDIGSVQQEIEQEIDEVVEEVDSGGSDPGGNAEASGSKTTLGDFEDADTGGSGDDGSDGDDGEVTEAMVDQAEAEYDLSSYQDFSSGCLSDHDASTCGTVWQRLKDRGVAPADDGDDGGSSEADKVDEVGAQWSDVAGGSGNDESGADDDEAPEDIDTTVETDWEAGQNILLTQPNCPACVEMKKRADVKQALDEGTLVEVRPDHPDWNAILASSEVESTPAVVMYDGEGEFV